jgi:hypothetical protein
MSTKNDVPWKHDARKKDQGLVNIVVRVGFFFAFTTVLFWLQKHGNVPYVIGWREWGSKGVKSYKGVETWRWNEVRI